MPLDGTNFEQQDAVLDLLRRARDRVARPGGWCQDHARDGFGYCVLGAISYFDKRPEHIKMKDILIESLPWWWCVCHGIIRNTENPAGVIIEYNDAPGRTQAEIVALFDRAIAKREASK